ncbi:MAG: HEAT repeat domain-containing protein [Deltaproteobacteria bacterium]|nr:HEAT repeat domain-containing protein [Deltaproteobacteria bacterium]
MSYLFPSSTITFDAALRDLEGGSPKARVLAASALADVTAPEEKRAAVVALGKALDDPRAEVRAEASAGLGVLGDERAVPGLLRRLDDGDAAVRQCAAIALGALGHADAWEPLAQALREGPADLRYQAASSLAELDPPRAYEPLVAALDDGDPQVLAAIALALGAIGDGRAVAHLARLLDHADVSVRFDAAYALAQLDDGRGRDVLATALGDSERAWDAIASLERLGGAADADQLAKVLGDRKAPPQIQLRAASAVLSLAPDHARAEAARRVLVAGTALRKPELRGLAVEELGKVGGPWAVDALAKLRNGRRGKDLMDEIDQAMRAIETRGRSERT